MKKKLFVSCFIAHRVALLTTGAFAYFSSTRTITGSHISAGTINLKLNNDCGTTWADTALAWNFDSMLPGEFVDQKICFKNAGTADIGRIWYNWTFTP